MSNKCLSSVIWRDACRWMKPRGTCAKTENHFHIQNSVGACGKYRAGRVFLQRAINYLPPPLRCPEVERKGTDGKQEQGTVRACERRACLVKKRRAGGAAKDYDEDPLLSPLRHLSSLKCVDTAEWPGHGAGPAARCVGSQIEEVSPRSQAKW